MPRGSNPNTANLVPFTKETARAAAIKGGLASAERRRRQKDAAYAYRALIKDRMAELPDPKDLPEMAESVVLMCIGDILAGRSKMSSATERMRVAKVCFEIVRLTREQPTTITETLSKEAAFAQFEALRKQAEQRIGLKAASE